MRYLSTLPGLQANTQIFGRHVFVLFYLKKFKKSFVVVVVATTIPWEQYPRSVSENSCNFTSSCSWRRRFNNNNNSKQCCFKNQRWQNNPFSSESKQKSGHLVPVSEWGVSQWLSLQTLLPTVPCQRRALSLAPVSVGLDSARWPGILYYYFFFCGRIFKHENRSRVVVNSAGTRAFDYSSQP